MYKIEKTRTSSSHTETRNSLRRPKRTAIIHESAEVISSILPSSNISSPSSSEDSMQTEALIHQENRYELHFHLPASECILPQDIDIKVHLTLHSLQNHIDKDCCALLVNNLTDPHLFASIFFEPLLIKILLQYQEHYKSLDLFVTIVYNVDSQSAAELIWKSPYKDIIKIINIKYVKKPDGIYSFQNIILNQIAYYLKQEKPAFLLSLFKSSYPVTMLQIIHTYLRQHTLISLSCELNIIIDSLVTADFHTLMQHLLENKPNELLHHEESYRDSSLSTWYLSTIVFQESLGTVKIIGVYHDIQTAMPTITLQTAGKSSVILTNLSEPQTYPLFMALATVPLATKLTQLAQARVMLDLLQKEPSIDFSLHIRDAIHIEHAYRDTLLMQLNRSIAKIMTLQNDLKQYVGNRARLFNESNANHSIEPFVLTLNLLLDERQQRQTDIDTLKTLDKDVTVFINTMAMFNTLLQALPDLLAQANQAASLTPEQSQVLHLFFPCAEPTNVSHLQWTDSILAIPKRMFNIQDNFSDTCAIIRNRTQTYHLENQDVYPFFSKSMIFYAQSLDYLWSQTGLLLNQGIESAHKHQSSRPYQYIQKMLKLITSWLDDIKYMALKLNMTYEIVMDLICDELYHQSMQLISDVIHKIQRVTQISSDTPHEKTKIVKFISPITTTAAHQALMAMTQMLQQYQALLLEIQNLNQHFQTYRQLRDEQQQRPWPTCPLQSSVYAMLNVLFQRHLFTLNACFIYRETQTDSQPLTLATFTSATEAILHEYYSVESYVKNEHTHIQPKTLTLSQSLLCLNNLSSSVETPSPLSIYASKIETLTLLDVLIKQFGQLKWAMVNIINSYTTIQAMLENKRLTAVSEQLSSYLPSELCQLIQDIYAFIAIKSNSAASSTEQLGSSLLNHLADIELDVVTECVDKVKQTLQTIRYHSGQIQCFDLFGLIEHYRQCDWIENNLLAQWDNLMTLTHYQTYITAIAERECRAPFPEIQSLGYQSTTKIYIVFLSVLVTLISAFTARHTQTAVELATPFEQSIYRLLKSKDRLTWRLLSEWLLTQAHPPIALTTSLQQIAVVFKYLETCEQADPIYRGTRFFSHYIRLKLFELSARQILEYGFLQAPLAAFALAIDYLTSLAEYLHPLKTLTNHSIPTAGNTEPSTRAEEVLTVFTQTSVNNHDDSISMRLCCGFFRASPRPQPQIEVLSSSAYQALRASI